MWSGWSADNIIAYLVAPFLGGFMGGNVYNMQKYYHHKMMTLIPKKLRKQ